MKGHNEVQSRFMRGRSIGAVIAVGALALSLAACSAAGTSTTTKSELADGFGSIAKNRTVYFLEPQTPVGDPFWTQISNGAKDAAKLANLKFVEQNANNSQAKYNNLIGAAVAEKPAAILVAINDPNYYTTNICKAHAEGIIVIAYNQSQTSAVSKCVDATVAQDFYSVGQGVGSALLKADPSLTKGSKVFFPVEFPSQNYALERGGGVQSQLDKVGAKGVYLGTGIDDASATSAMTAWLVSNKDVAAITPLGGTPNRDIVAALKQAGLADKHIPIIGFDTSTQVVANIKDGTIIAVADQQGYVQGFQSVMEAELDLDFGLSPANYNSGGLGLITKANVSDLSSKQLQGIRY